jgi:hypothetical protein
MAVSQNPPNTRPAYPPREEADRLSYSSLRLTLFGPPPAELELAQATGFTVSHEGKVYLVSNWHVFSGRDPVTGELMDQIFAALPDSIAVDFHDGGLAGRWKRARFPLYDAAGVPRWRDHPAGVRHRDAVDVAVLQIDPPTGVKLYHFPEHRSKTGERVSVAGVVFIIGFPVGLAVGDNFPIWLSGRVACDPIFDYDRRPILLIDARTRKGMSGSPVIIRTNEIYSDNGLLLMTVGAELTKFLGIYSGRVHADADIGYVWRPHVLDELLCGHLIERKPGRLGYLLPGDDSPISEVD